VIGVLKIAAGLLTGVSLLTLVAPVVGEAIATLPPAFPKETGDLMSKLGLPYEDVAFPTSEGLTLRGWFIKAKKADAPALVYAPATARDQRSGLSLVPAFHSAGYHVLLFSYRGHALSDGKKGHFTYGDAESRDVDAAVRFLHESRGIQDIAIVGHSAGATSAILSAARNPRVGAVVAVAPFNCVAEVWRTSRPALVPHFVLDWTLWVIELQRGFNHDEVSPLDVVDLIAPRPLLVIHGTGDQRITEKQVRRLFEAAQGPKSLWLVDGASHDSIRDPVLDELALEVISFLDSAWLGQNESGIEPDPGLTGLATSQDSLAQMPDDNRADSPLAVPFRSVLYPGFVAGDVPVKGQSPQQDLASLRTGRR
jgi:alpha-beta hydrolase superfamily lysophospholipase